MRTSCKPVQRGCGSGYLRLKAKIARSIFVTVVASIAVLSCQNSIQAAEVFDTRQSYLMLVFSNPLLGRDSEYSGWYDNVHAPEVVTNDGVVSALRFAANPVAGGKPQNPPRQYMVTYSIETSDIKKTYEGFSSKVYTAPAAPVIDEAKSYALTYRAIGKNFSGAGEKTFGKGAAQLYEFIVLDDASLGKETEFNAWYDLYHAADLCGTPGFVSAQRYVRSEVQRDKSAPSPKYMIVYKIMTDDIDAVFALIRARAENFTKTTTVNETGAEIFTYRAVSKQISRKPT